MPKCEGHRSVYFRAMPMTPIGRKAFLLQLFLQVFLPFSFNPYDVLSLLFLKLKEVLPLFPVCTHLTWFFFSFTKPRAIKLLCSLSMATKCSVDCSLGWGDWVANGKTSWEWLELLSYSGNAQLLSLRKLRTNGADSSLFNCYRPHKYQEEGKAGTLTEIGPLHWNAGHQHKDTWHQALFKFTRILLPSKEVKK